jgi:hypothetical protein
MKIIHKNKIELEPFSFSNLDNLKTLFIDLYSMKNGCAFEPLKSLKSLTLITTDCGFYRMDPTVFKYIENIEELYWKFILIPEA